MNESFPGFSCNFYACLAYKYFSYTRSALKPGHGSGCSAEVRWQNHVTHLNLLRNLRGEIIRPPTEFQKA